MSAAHLITARARGALRRGRMAWLRWRLRATRDALTAALSQPVVGPEFVAEARKQMNDFERGIAQLST